MPSGLKHTGKPCSADGCTNHRHYCRGFCKRHYGIFRKANPTGNAKSSHPMFAMWEDRRYSGVLCDEWRDFWKFVEGVGERKHGNFILCRLTSDRPYGPDNFIWKEHLKRMDGESQKAWNLRMRHHQIQKFPTFERGRELRRKYGLTIAQYEAMKTDQDNRCAICGNEEKRHEHRTGNKRKLAVDHSHDTGVIRGLLCWECNTTLGRMGESVERLEAMIRYIKKHSKPDLRVIQGVG